MKAKKLKPERINEIIGVLFLLLGLYALISLLFFHPNDHSFYTSYPNQQYRNVTGVAGVYLAHYLRLSFGLSSFSIPILFLFWSSCFFLQRVPQKKWIEFLGIAISLLSIASLFSLLAGEHWKMNAGGFTGYFIAANLEKYFGIAGGLIISICCLALSLILATDFLLYPLFEKLLEWAKNRIAEIRDRFPLKKEWGIKFKKPESKKESQPFLQKLTHPFIIPKVKKYGSFKEALTESSERFKQTEEEKEVIFNEALKSVVRVKKIKETITGQSSSSVEHPKKKNQANEPQLQETKVSLDSDASFINYQLPSTSLLKSPTNVVPIEDDLQGNSRILEETLRDFGIEAKVIEIEQGPVITRYELMPAPGVKINRIASLSDDLALVLKATSIRFLTPIPGKSAVGIEIPNSTTTTVFLKELLESNEYRKNHFELPLLLGKDTSGRPIVSDLTEMPHLLIAGATGSGKTVCVNSLIAGLLFSRPPHELKFVMVDPKMVELATYHDIPHMLTPVVTDVRKAAGTLNWLVSEMERRYQIFATCGTRNIQAFNNRKRSEESGETEKANEIPKSLPYIILVIDELADLMVVAQDKVETAITRLAQLSRAVGIHLILATQRPSVDVITGVIKANFPARISFKVASKVDSRTVLDMNGADKLLGKGDMLFLKPGEPKPTRGQATFITDEEISSIVQFIKEQQGPQYLSEIEAVSDGKSSHRMMEKDELYDEAVRIVLETRQASVSVLQRKLRLGYGRAARIIDMMEQEGIVGSYQGSKPRDILVDRVQEVGESSASDS
ncbi:MAG: DNA translocase FtsK [Candidatus Omnitrophica bacterium]|nr:DNA translocase FtsK [Candidatus Omnitrophota bacterium]